MEELSLLEIKNKLLTKSKENGYLTFDDFESSDFSKEETVQLLAWAKLQGIVVLKP